MCGIVAYIGSKSAPSLLLEGLRRLEYRGYDSAGIAVVTQPGALVCIRSKGAIHDLEPYLSALPASAYVGIGHTRWATHGPPSEHNAHPHVDCSQRFAVVHNGIIENYASLKQRLEKTGHRFTSETDTEVLVHLLEEQAQQKPHASLGECLASTLAHVQGTYGIAVLDKQRPEELAVARLGSPMAIGIGDHEYIIASDPSALIAHTRQIIFLDDLELAHISSQAGLKIRSLKHAQDVHKHPQTIEWSLEDVQKNGHAHFMLKEIFLSARTSAGIWKVAPPIRRLRTSTAGVTFATAFFHISYPSSLVNLLTFSKAS